MTTNRKTLTEMIEAKDFKIQAEKLSILEWPIHKCSLCGYQCGFHFLEGKVFYDNGCYCTNGESLKIRDWQSVADHYNLQSHPSAIQKYNEFWGFDKNTN